MSVTLAQASTIVDTALKVPGVIGAMNIRLPVSNPSIRPGESRSTLGIQHSCTLSRDW